MPLLLELLFQLLDPFLICFELFPRLSYAVFVILALLVELSLCRGNRVGIFPVFVLYVGFEIFDCLLIAGDSFVLLILDFGDVPGRFSLCLFEMLLVLFFYLCGVVAVLLLREFELFLQSACLLSGLSFDLFYLLGCITFGLFGALKHIATASLQVVHTGSPSQIREAQKILNQARRALYHLLAEDGADDSDD